MDIGVPYREIARVDVADLKRDVLALSDADWAARPIRKASLAGGAHNAADSIVLRHEWTPKASKRGFPTIQASLLDWAARSNRDGRDLLPVMEERNADTWIYTFPDWTIWQERVLPVILDVIGALDPQPRGVLNRALFVRLAPGAVVPEHVDEQPLAARTHRIHLALSDNPDCVYTIGDTEFTMTSGVAYDFNNRWKHGVRNNGMTPRINMMLEYLPDPAWIGPAPIVYDLPAQS